MSLGLRKWRKKKDLGVSNRVLFEIMEENGPTESRRNRRSKTFLYFALYKRHCIDSFAILLNLGQGHRCGHRTKQHLLDELMSKS